MKKLLLTLFLLSSFGLQAQNSKTTADSLLLHQDFKEAQKGYQNWLKQHPQDSDAWYKLGKAEQARRSFTGAIKSYEKALDKGYAPTYAYYNMAYCQAQLGDQQKTLESLEQSVNHGFSLFNWLDTVDVFMPLQDEQAFQDIYTKAKANAYPCLNNSKHRIFDFWIGHWTVYVRGQKAGDSEITRSEGGCAIHEHYVSSRGPYSGQSVNYYDPKDQKWHQNWVGSGGDVTHYIETQHHENYLQFEGKTLTRKGTLVLNRMTFSYDPEQDQVHQVIESSTDDGQTWSPGFDGWYRRKSQ